MEERTEGKGREEILWTLLVIGRVQTVALRPVSHSWFERFRTIFRVTAIVC